MSSRPTFDPLDLAVMANAVAMIAEEMGTVLERGSLSPNIRERRDASSALFDAQGRMVAQAAHIPVHLGAMPESVRAVRDRDPAPGDVFILNSPFHGGSHLPDLTLVEAIDVEGARKRADQLDKRARPVGPLHGCPDGLASVGERALNRVLFSSISAQTSRWSAR